MSTVARAAGRVTVSGRGNVVVTWPAFDLDDPEMGGALRDAGFGVTVAPSAGPRSAQDVAGLVRAAVGVIASSDPFDQMVFESAPNLRVIVRTGVGVDAIDVEAATRSGVAVITLPGANAETCADHTMALMLAAARRLPENTSAVLAGDWSRGGLLTPWDIHATCVGLVGFGRIGQAVGRRLAGFGVELLVSDPAAEPRSGLTVTTTDDLLRRADVVSLHAPYDPAVGPLLGARELSLLKPTAILVNTARGGLVDEQALEGMLREGRLRAAALDVFVDEPPLSRTLIELPNVIATPHIAGLSVGTNHLMSVAAANAVIEFLDGGRPVGLINPELGE
jgi:glyoxylate reductase